MLLPSKTKTFDIGKEPSITFFTIPLLSIGSVIYINDDTIKPGTPKGGSFRYIGRSYVLQEMHKHVFLLQSLQKPHKRRMVNIRLRKAVGDSQMFLSRHLIFSKGMEQGFPSQMEPSSLLTDLQQIQQ